MIQLQALGKTYEPGHTRIQALADIELSIDRGEFLTIMGPSGSGKSTLLHLLGLMDRPTTGAYLLEGHDVTSLSDREMSRIRNQHFGFVFQSFNLFPEFNALENVMMPLLYARVPPGRRNGAPWNCWRGWDSRTASTTIRACSPAASSSGWPWRALANDPDLILADEPTGNLPSSMGLEILGMLRDLNEQGTTIVMVTHDDKLATCGRRMVRIEDGRIIADEPVRERFDPRRHDDLRREA